MITKEILKSTLDELELSVQEEGDEFIHTVRGNYAPVLQTVISVDEGGQAATLVTLSNVTVPEPKREAIFELLNHVHGQSLSNVRFHLNGQGFVLAIGKLALWEQPFNISQFGDIFFSLLTTADRIFPCLSAVLDKDETAQSAFDRFFGAKTDAL